MFDEAAWLRYRSDTIYGQYPCPRGKWRFDLTLSYPRRNLEDVPIDRNPHGGGFTGHSCFYSCDDWSTIFNVCEDFYQYGEPIDYDGNVCLRMVVESQCPEPIWGERIRLLSTSSYIQNEEWGTNPANKFAYFRGMYWRVVQDHFLHNGYAELYDVMGGRINYPIRMEPYPRDGNPVAGPIRIVTNRGAIDWDRFYREIWEEDQIIRQDLAIVSEIDWREFGF